MHQTTTQIMYKCIRGTDWSVHLRHQHQRSYRSSAEATCPRDFDVFWKDSSLPGSRFHCKLHGYLQTQGINLFHRSCELHQLLRVLPGFTASTVAAFRVSVILSCSYNLSTSFEGCEASSRRSASLPNPARNKIFSTLNRRAKFENLTTAFLAFSRSSG